MYAIYDINMKKIEGGFASEQEAEWWAYNNVHEEYSIQEDGSDV